MIHNWENYFDISSEYWLKVEKIYEDSESFPKKVVKDRNLHHKFPRSFSKKDGTEIDNDEDNLVSLSLADHFRVHYYLWKCSKKGYRGMMAMAFTLMRKKAVVYATDETIEQIAKDYEEAMKEAAHASSEANKGNKNFLGHHHTNEAKNKISASKKGKKRSEETKRKISATKKGKQVGENHTFYGKHHSDETKKKLSEANKGKKLSAETKRKISEATKCENNPMYGKHHSEESKKKISEAKKGTHLSEKTKNKTSEAMKGMRWFNNGEKCVRAIECPPGFVPGRIK